MENERRDIRELEGLLQQAISPEQFYRRYLELLTHALPGVEGIHLWILQGQDFVPLGGSDRKELLDDENADQRIFISELLRKSAMEQAGVFVPGSEEGNLSPKVLAATPLLHGRGGGAVQGAQLCWWPPDKLAEAQAAGPILQRFADCGAQMVRAQRLESMSQVGSQLQLMTQFLAEISTAADAKALAVTVVNRARETVDCERCALLTLDSHEQLELAAVSNVPSPDSRSTTSRTIIQLADHARKTGLPALFRKASEKTEEKGDLSDYFYHSNMQEALVMPIQPPGEGLTALLVLESERKNFFDNNKIGLASPIAVQAATPLRTAILREDIPLRSLLEKIARWRRLPAAEKKHRLRRKLWIPLAIVAAICLFPVQLRFTGEARLLPQVKALCVSQVEGRVVEVLAGAGDQVEAGQILARLDDTELRKQVKISEQEEARLQAEADRLLGLQERTAAQVAQLELMRARRETEFHQTRLEQASLRSPISGVIMTPELRSRQGDALQPGSQLAMVGDPSSWELEVKLPERDVAALLETLRSEKSVSVNFKLAAIPQKTFQTVLSDASAVSAASEVSSGRNVFRIVIPLAPEPEYNTLFRSGYTGRARFVIGYRPLAYTSTRRFLNWLRTSVLF